NDEQREATMAKAREVESRLRNDGVRVKVDARDHLNPGSKFYEWERKGVPLRIEIGPKDLEKGSLCIARRLVPEGEKRRLFVAEDEALGTITSRLDAMQEAMKASALARREANSHRGV